MSIKPWSPPVPRGKYGSRQKLENAYMEYLQVKEHAYLSHLHSFILNTGGRDKIDGSETGGCPVHVYAELAQGRRKVG